MFEGLTIPIVAKFCAAAVVVGGAGVVTYEVTDIGKDAPSSIESESPDALAFADGDGDDSGPEDKDPFRRAKEEAEAAEIDDAATEEGKRDETGEDEGDHGNDRRTDERESDEKDEVEPVDVDVEAHVVILWPEDGSHFDDEWVVFEGESEPGSKVFAGPYEATVDAEGNWRIELRLAAGQNKATIRSEDPAGNVAEDSVTLWLDVAEPVEEPVEKPHEEEEEHEEEIVEVEFSANQKYGSCEEEVPYDVFWGTATPNTVVTITSEYGGAVVEVGEKGHWEKKVYFETAPRGVEFLVTVTGANGTRNFEFVAAVIAGEGDGEGGEEEPK